MFGVDFSGVPSGGYERGRTLNWLAGGGTRLGVVLLHFHHRPMPMALMAEYEDMFVADIQLALSAPSAPSGMSLPAPRPPRRRSPWSATCCSSWCPVSCRCPVVGLSFGVLVVTIVGFVKAVGCGSRTMRQRDLCGFENVSFLNLLRPPAKVGHFASVARLVVVREAVDLLLQLRKTENKMKSCWSF